ncbi:MAG: ComF family protein [Methylophilus sp.]|uniref:ComF family protein n=1 Tax=Methylophilus sp. TaxID=29541 RepID=UPI003FA0A6A6
MPCLLCAAPAQKQPQITHAPLCTTCAASLPWYTSERCPQCALPTLSGAYCGVCLQHAPAFDTTLAPLRYAYPLDRLLQQFKYHQQLPIGKLLARCILPHLSPLLSGNKPDVMVAMPMHPYRVRQRGFNHALELARHLQPALQIPLDITGCTRIVDTLSQAGMDMKTRTRNLRGAFASNQQWQGKHVLVVDDVMTTGASMHALANALKQAGAGRVTALVVARTLKGTEN